MAGGLSALLYGSLSIALVRSVNEPLRVNVGMSMSLSPTTSGGSPALIEVASEVTSSLIEVSVSLTWRFLCVALNSLTSFWARVLETVRAQNWTVPVALTPKFADPGDATPSPMGRSPMTSTPTAAAATRAAAEKSANLVLFMCPVPSRRLRR